MKAVVRFAQRVGRVGAILLLAALGVLIGASADEGAAWGRPPPAHTSSKPQPLPAQPYNLYSLLNDDDLVAEIERRYDPSDWRGHMERVTRGLVAAPYLLSALGEGRGVDADPRFRLDAFDCTTFVETAIALAHCDDYDQLPRLLDTIRYTDGLPSYQTRRHLITSQWIPELTTAGFIEDITDEVGGDETAYIDLNLTKRRWKKRRVARTLPLAADRVPYGEYELPYVPIAVALKRMRSVPPGTIINVVRAESRRSPEVVSHQGLVLVRPGSRKRWVRHASPVAKRVIDESLKHMLRRYLKPRKWPIVGVNLLKVVPPARRARQTKASARSGLGPVEH